MDTFFGNNLSPAELAKTQISPPALGHFVLPSIQLKISFSPKRHSLFPDLKESFLAGDDTHRFLLAFYYWLGSGWGSTVSAPVRSISVKFCSLNSLLVHFF